MRLGYRYLGLLACSAVVAIACLGAGCGKKPPVTKEPPKVPIVRVGLAHRVSRARFSCNGGQMRITVRGDGNNQAVTISDSEEMYVLPGAGTVRVTERSREKALLSGSSVSIRPVGGALLTLGGKPYRGSFEVFARSGTITLVNVLDVESYLRGVVPPEIGNLSESGFEALKAQAVAARTYTLAHMGHRGEMGFDVYPTVEDQVYFGVSAEEKLADKAIRETAGMVITYKGKLIEAYYSSSCGGRTANVEDGWARDPVPYLSSRWDRASGCDGYLCEISPNYRWDASWTAEQLKRQLADFLRSRGNLGENEDLGEILDVKIKKKSESRRVIHLEIKTTKRTVVLDRYEIRQALKPPGQGGRGLRSTLFRIKTRHSGRRLKSLSIRGGGYGHGVGMCQWGAIRMSQIGYRYEEILKHYYDGVDIAKRY